MKKILFALLLAPICSMAADPQIFEGEWSGKGVYLKDGYNSACPTFNLSFETKPRSLKFSSGNRVCERHEETFAPVEMQFADGNLYWNGRKIGTIQGNYLTVSFRAPEPNGQIRNYRMSMRRQGSTLVYEESRTMNSDVEPLIVFSGVLTKVKE